VILTAVLVDGFMIVFFAFMQDNHLLRTDLSRLNDAYTYCSDNSFNLSWIDHILCSRSVDISLSLLLVLYDYVSSDHKPLSVCLTNFISSQNPQDCSPYCFFTNDNFMQHVWAKADQYQLTLFHKDVDLYISNIQFPKCLICCSEYFCADPIHHSVNEQYYDDVFLPYIRQLIIVFLLSVITGVN